MEIEFRKRSRLTILDVFNTRNLEPAIFQKKKREAGPAFQS
jgi:hypothetical protein